MLFEWVFKTNQVQDEKLSELLQNSIEQGIQNHALDHSKFGSDGGPALSSKNQFEYQSKC